jgi:thioesterase domain-containing protein
MLSIMTKALRKAGNLSAYLAGQQVKEVWDEIRLRLLRFYLDRGRAVPRLLEQIPVRTVYLFAERTYQPESKFDGELLLLRATTGEGTDEPYINRYEDPSLGWGRRATHGVRVCDVAGGHSSMLQEPHVQILAEQLQISIDDVFTNRPAAPHESKPVGLGSSRQASHPAPTTC